MQPAELKHDKKTSETDFCVKKGRRNKFEFSRTENRISKSVYSNCSSCYFEGGPEPLEKEIHEILGSKREDRFSNPFFGTGTKNMSGSFFVPAATW